MGKLRLAIVALTAAERAELELLANRRKTAQALALRARIVLGCASGMHDKDVAARLDIDPVTVSKWRRCFFWLTGLRVCAMNLARGHRARFMTLGSRQ